MGVKLGQEKNRAVQRWCAAGCHANMKLPFVLLICFIAAAGCKKGAGSDCTPAREEVVFYQNKAIDISDTLWAGGDKYYRYQIGDGNGMVFERNFYFESCPDRIDGGGLQTIAFQIPSGTTSFSFTDSASLRQANTLVKFYCGECFGGVRFLTNGYIKGKQIDENTWSVEASLSSPASPSAVYSINANFKKN